MTVGGHELIKGKILIDNVILKQISRFMYLGCDTLDKKRKVKVQSRECAINFKITH